METYSPKLSEISNKWYVIDAEGVSLGRLAAFVSQRLRGKYKASFSSNINCGDNIIIVNLEKLNIASKKLKGNYIYSHSGYPGGIKQKSWGEIVNGKYPERLFKHVVKGMMPKGPLGRAQLKRLFLYKGAYHPHSAQSPEKIDFAELNSKNKRN